MTKVYFVRHAKPDFSVKDDLLRPLTEEAMEERKKVTEFLTDKDIKRVFSSPYKRAIDTIKHFAESMNLNIDIIDDFRERKVDNVWIEDFNTFTKEQWIDFNYKLDNGECLYEVQNRNIRALMQILAVNAEHNIVIGSHGTALSTIINYFNKEFGDADFERIKDLMPFIVCFTFEGQAMINVEEFILE
jgi:2,3-bisphosphoglycerate-dependent phosphoglycerate mutase